MTEWLLVAWIGSIGFGNNYGGPVVVRVATERECEIVLKALYDVRGAPSFQWPQHKCIEVKALGAK